MHRGLRGIILISWLPWHWLCHASNWSRRVLTSIPCTTCPRAGMYVPTLVEQVYLHRADADAPRLQGFAVGNGIIGTRLDVLPC